MRLSVWVWGYIYWGAIWLLIGFLLPELLGEYRVAPWRTLSETVWHSERTYPFVAPALFATFIALSLHFFYHRRLEWSVIVGLALAMAAHLIDKRIP